MFLILSKKWFSVKNRNKKRNFNFKPDCVSKFIRTGVQSRYEITRGNHVQSLVLYIKIRNLKFSLFLFYLRFYLFVCFFLGGGCGPDCSRQWNCTFVFRTITPNQNNRWIYLKIKQILGNGTTTFVGPQFFLFDFTGATRTNSIWHWGQGTAFSWI